MASLKHVSQINQKAACFDGFVVSAMSFHVTPTKLVNYSIILGTAPCMVILCAPGFIVVTG